ncbi:MAG TPA: glycosyltransferase [Xanthobacteraceae bacterium]|nr:glycosyltransferase [Xanthobacteraceae bacterium]
MILEITAFVALAIWSYLAVGRGAFWRCTERDDGNPRPPAVWPSLAVVIPARDEADVIGPSLNSLLNQDYRGPWSVVLVDDNSRDRTGDIAWRVGCDCSAANRVTIVSGAPLPSGWTGKLWALSQGIAVAQALDHPVEYFLLSDADIVYAPEILHWLVAHAISRDALLASFMVKLRCDSRAERFLVPAFIFFFQMLYPFSWVNRRDRATAAAAGGCMLVRADTLRDIGGVGAIRNALIDDCALARKFKAKGRIWLGLTHRVTSIRSYPRWADVAQMVSRSAYAQLGYSLVQLAGTVLALMLTFVVPPMAALAGAGYARLFGFSAWAIMALLFLPTLRIYRISPLYGVALPATAFAYLMFTLNSAFQSIRGKGGFWKGRFQATGAK